MFSYFILGEKALLNPHLISMAAGYPNPVSFPFIEATVKLKCVDVYTSLYIYLSFDNFVLTIHKVLFTL